MNNEHIYTGFKVRTHFTAYLMNLIRGRRRKYIEKNFSRINAECPLKEWEHLVDEISLDGYLEAKRKESLLLEELRNIFPAWDEMDDRKLFAIEKL